MNERIQELAEQAGFNEYILENVWAHEQPEFFTLLENIANLVAAAEREACAELCDQVGDRDRDSHAYDAAAAIRERGENERTN